jgi:Protein of unknown function (DUF3500)
MRISKPLIIALSLVLAVVASTWLLAQGRAQPSASATSSDATAKIVAAAQALVAALDDSGRAKLQFPFEGPQKTRWSNLPSPMFKREGIRIADLTPPQRAAVTALLQAALSPDGYRKVTEIMTGDEVLKTGQGGGRGRQGGPAFGQGEYYVAFLGTPSVTTPWMLQFGGHHLAINLTLAGAQVSMTPSLPAAQPARFTLEGREIRPLGKENDKGFALINALDAGQRAQAILGSRVADLVLGPGQDGRVIQPEGLRASAMNASQQTMLLELIREWAGIMNDAFARPRMDEIRTNLSQTYFAWSGPTENGTVAYFRVQGPTLVIEYAPQNSVDHIHTIYRDPTNDYGSKIAK